VEGEVGGDRLGAEGTGVFLFIQELDFADPHTVVIEGEVLRVIDGVTEFDFLSDVGRGHLVEGAFEADGGIVIDYPFMTNEEDLIEFGLRESMDLHSGNGGVVTVDGPLPDSFMKFVMVILL
jgi:hypothetical protein